MKKGTHMNAGTNRGQGSKKRAHIRVAHERTMRSGKIVYIKAVIVNKELLDFEKLSIKERVKYCLYFSAPINNVEYANPKPIRPSLRVGTAFSGIGAPEWALKQLGIEHTNEFMVEIDKNARKSYLANFTPKQTFEDITKIDYNALNDIDIFFFGSPCQSFSMQGKRRGLEDTRGTLVYNGLQIIKAKQPKYFVYENVKGMLTHDKGNTFNVIKAAFEELNYTIQYKVLNAKNYGSPQNRERLFIVGIRKDINQTFKFPQPLSYIPSVNNIIKMDEPITDNLLLDTTFIVSKVPNPKTDIKIVAEFSNLRYASDKRICSTQGISPCLTKGGSKTRFFDTKHNVYRRLSEQELSRIQGFGDEYVFPVANTHIKEQLGNSMAVQVMQSLLTNLVPHLLPNTQEETYIQAA
jgi:DNA (cytosine-5)-methyltransferase 1